MLTDPLTLHNGYYLINRTAWLGQRIGAHHGDYSTRLQQFTSCEVFENNYPAMDITARMQLWCAAQGFLFDEAAAIEHDDDRLTTPIAIVLAAVLGILAQPLALALALVSINGATPQVYADNTDEHFWRDAGTIQLSCPARHGWASSGGPWLFADDGSDPHVTSLFGPSGSVISCCRDCAAFDDGGSDSTCLCSGYAVYCPVCAMRCRVGLPSIPTCQVPA